MPSTVDAAGRAIAGLLGYNPGPGIYSRLERAVEAMPENVRVQEIPGLIKRYKDGVPGWELNAVDLDSVVAGRAVVPRSEILAAVRERSPVYTHQEVVLGGRPQRREITEGSDWLSSTTVQPDYQRSASPIGSGVSHGEPHYGEYGQGGTGYSELLLLQPDQSGLGFGSHWSGRGLPLQDPAVAHARFDIHGDALRINELQSDLGIHNRKQREHADLNPQILFGERLNPASQAGLPFPLEDAWADILIKRLALEAAQGGHRAIEIASPRAIADKVGGNIENYEHFYGKVVPGALERLGRKMGGLSDASPPPLAAGYAKAYEDLARRYHGPYGEALNELASMRPPPKSEDLGEDGLELLTVLTDETVTPGERFDLLAKTYRGGDIAPDEEFIDFSPGMRLEQIQRHANSLYETAVEDLVARGVQPDAAKSRVAASMPRLMRLAEDQARHADGLRFLAEADAERAAAAKARNAISRRYIMSDEMRRRILMQGIGASLLAPVAAGGMSDGR